MKIGNKEISETGKAYIIAEVGQAHEGSIGNAHAFIDTASKTGVDAIKFQAHFAAEESTRDEKFRVNFSYQDIDRFDYWKRMEISPGHLKELKEHAESLNMEFICSPFSLYAIDVLEDINVNASDTYFDSCKKRELLDKLKLFRICCRRHMLGHVDLIDII